MRGMLESGSQDGKHPIQVGKHLVVPETYDPKIVFREPAVSLRIPSADLTTDNAIMIALAGFYHAARGDFADPVSLAANGNRSLA